MKNEFVDAQEMGKKHPNTFYSPSKEELKTIKKGTFVKVCRNEERFWCEVVSVNGNMITGRVDNGLVNEENSDIPYNNEITFEMKNVYDIIEG